MKKILLPIIFLLSNCAISQTAGTLDLNFGNNGVAYDDVKSYGYFPYSISIQENSGNIFTGGSVTTLNPTKASGYVRKLDFYGKPITSFGNNGILKINFPQANNQTIFQIVPDNAILGTQGFYLRGSLYNNNNDKVLYISKHNEDGSLDLNFGNNGIINIDGQISGNHIYSLTLNPSTGKQTLKRFHLNNGTLDTSFANEELPLLDNDQHFISGQYNHINIQKDGKIVLVGQTKYLSDKYTSVARFNSNGNLDTSFGNNGVYINQNQWGSPPLESITQSDGKIVYLDQYNQLTRLNSNGTLDISYGNNGTFKLNEGIGDNLYMYAYHLNIQDDDKIYFNGEFKPNYSSSGNTSIQFLIRLNTNGTKDFEYRNFETNDYSEIWSNAIVNDSFILANGVYTNNETATTNWYNVIQRLYTKKPVLSVFGSATNNIDIDLTTLDNSIFTGKMNLYAGTLKYRLDHKNTYTWGGIFPSGNSTMGKNEIVIPQNGEYEVSFNLKNGEFSITNPLSTNESLNNIVKLYPNPVLNELNFTKTVSEIIIFDKSGKIVSRNIGKLKIINLKNLPAGLYTISFKSEEGKVIKKEFIKK